MDSFLVSKCSIPSLSSTLCMCKGLILLATFHFTMSIITIVGSVKVKPVSKTPFGHSRAVSDHAVSTFNNGESSFANSGFKEPTFHSFTTSKTLTNNSTTLATTTSKQSMKVASTSKPIVSTSQSTDSTDSATKTATSMTNTTIAKTSVSQPASNINTRSVDTSAATAIADASTLQNNVIGSRSSVKSQNSKLVSPGTKGIAPPPLPEKRTKPTSGRSIV